MLDLTSVDAMLLTASAPTRIRPLSATGFSASQASCECSFSVLPLQMTMFFVQASASGGGYQHPYDLGCCGNLHAICGGNPLLWLIPNRAAGMGDGTVYPTSWDSSAEHDAFSL